MRHLGYPTGPPIPKQKDTKPSHHQQNVAVALNNHRRILMGGNSPFPLFFRSRTLYAVQKSNLEII